MPDAQPPIRVAVVDDNELIGEALRRWLGRNPGYRFIGSFESIDAARAPVTQAGPCILLLDVDMPGSDTFATLPRIAADLPDTRIVMLSGHVRREYVERALDSGAAGYIVKDEEIPVIMDLIRRAAAGEVVLSPTAKSALANGQYEPATTRISQPGPNGP